MVYSIQYTIQERKIGARLTLLTHSSVMSATAAEERNLQQPCCPICLDFLSNNTISDPENVLETKCGHKFHKLCLGSAIRSGSYVCPVCRASFGEFTTPETKHLKRYAAMLKANIPREAVRQCMEVNGLSASVIHDFFTDGMGSRCGVSGHEARDSSSSVYIDYERYSKLLKIGLPEDAIRHKMIKANISPDLVDKFFVDFCDQLLKESIIDPSTAQESPYNT